MHHGAVTGHTAGRFRTNVATFFNLCFGSLTLMLEGIRFGVDVDQATVATLVIARTLE